MIAAQHGSIAASHLVEQIGLPQVTYSDASGELWNETKVYKRLNKYQRRVEVASLRDYCRL